MGLRPWVEHVSVQVCECMDARAHASVNVIAPECELRVCVSRNECVNVRACERTCEGESVSMRYKYKQG